MHAVIAAIIAGILYAFKRRIIMNVKLKKAVRNLRINPARTALVIFALFIGLWGIGSIIVSYIILTNDLNENFLKTKPFHVALTSKNFDRLSLAAFRDRAEVESAEFRDLSKERIEILPNRWVPLWIFGVENFNNLNLAEFYHEEGKKVADPGTMLIERDGQKISNLKLGSVARVRAGDAKLIEVPITGLTFDPVQAPTSQEHFIYSYVDKKTYMNITGKAANERLVFRLKNVNTKQDIQTMVKTIFHDFGVLGITVDRVIIPKLNEHPHQWQLNTLLFLEGSIGFLAFLMGAVLVWQLMGAILARQVRQIGVLKAIGASRVQVFEIYLTMVLLLGIAASVIGIPLAVISGYAFADFVSGQLNFNILTKKLPIHMYLYLIAAGILLPILASLPALLKGTKVTVHDAINDYGIQQNKDGNRVGAVARLPLSNSMVLALRNTMRRKKRLAITIITMALGVAIFSTGFNVQQPIIKLLAETRTALKYDVQLMLKDPLPIEQALSPFASIDNVSRIETRGGGKGVIQTNTIETTDEATVFALPWDTEMLALEVIQGRWLQATDEPEIVVNQKVLESFDNPVLGEYYTLNIKGMLLKVKLVGIVEEFALERIYIDKSVYDKSFGTGQLVKSLMFVAKDNDYDKILTLEGDIEKAIGPSILSVGNIESQTGRMQVLYDHLNVILVMLLSMALLVLVVGSLGMASAMSINVMERTREIGVLRAIGATPKMIYGLFVTEGMVISIAGIVLGLLLSWPLSTVAAGFFGDLILNYPLKFALSNLGIVITLVVTLTFGWLASRIPAVKAIRVSTREALSYE